jgi:hypothetical protein
MAADIDAVAVAAEARRIIEDPGDRAAHLSGHRKQAAAASCTQTKSGTTQCAPARMNISAGAE